MVGDRVTNLRSLTPFAIFPFTSNDMKKKDRFSDLVRQTLNGAHYDRNKTNNDNNIIPSTFHVLAVCSG